MPSNNLKPKYFRMTEATVQKVKSLQDFFAAVEGRSNVSETEVVTKCVTFYYNQYLANGENAPLGE